ncbi:magnesium transporter [Bacillus sp. HMF5848]|uniref:magnesium transporter n=1 Tax=Bacillus sp. HMF5848 TaxID=2495421 RepID=UPI000F79E57A|nr:magnesium transporter [Bacillus sp. HMF5848]RSK26504.1 magnesium transporter [Bacillus sp. HMF5848]
MSEMTEKERELQQEHEEILELLRKNQLTEFRELFLSLHEYDQAKLFESFSIDDRMQLYHYLSPEETARIIENIQVDSNQYSELMAEMDPAYAANMLAQMYADDAVDVLNQLDKEQVASYLTIMDKSSAEEIKDLLHYEEYTAGSIMTTEFIAIEANQTVRSAMYIIKNEAQNAETIYYIYVVDENKKLAGVISIRDLIVHHDDTMIYEILNERVVTVSVSEDQEEVAKKMKDYDFLALPVIDFQNHLLGIVTVDDIIDVLEEEATDDYSKLAGISDVGTMDRGPWSASKKRLPWLIVLLFIGMMTASLMGRFEETLDQVAVLAVFIPLIAGMAGNSGTQALAVAVRGLATGEITKGKVWSILAREAGTGFINGIACGILVTGLVTIWQQNFMLGILVGVSVLGTLIVATLAGSFVPIIMNKFNIDPAVASGPFITTINDIISILIYLGTASLFINYLI